jgi:hypothetical protein
VLLGADEQYAPVCWGHYEQLTAAAARPAAVAS